MIKNKARWLSLVKSAGLKILFIIDSRVQIPLSLPIQKGVNMAYSRKQLKKMQEAIESMGVEIVQVDIIDHIKLRIKNPQTGTVKLITVSKSPRTKGKFDEIKSSVRKVFRKQGEII